jgi:hypothetical protein
VDALAGTTKQVNAHTAISFLSSEYRDLFSLPGGNSGIARHLLQKLRPDVFASKTILLGEIRADRLDANESVRLRQKAVLLHADTNRNGVTATYFHEGRFQRAAAKALIVASQAHSAQHAVSHLLGEEQRAAFSSITLVPVVIANVALRHAAPLAKLGLGYNQYYWGSKYWADFVVADWTTSKRSDPDRPTVLTFYGANEHAPELMPVERVKLLTTPFADYEASLREDLSRVLAGTGFEFDRDVSDVFIYRWGHGMVYPKPGFPFGSPGGTKEAPLRTPSARHVARAQLGRISFAGQDTERSPSVEAALGSGRRAAKEALELLRK